MSDRPRTPAQIAASRANGRRSKGPKTDPGKRRSRLNAVKHGLRSKIMRPRPGDETAAAKALTDAVLERLQPADDAERELADGVVAALWRMRRATQIECEVLGLRPGEPEAREPNVVARAFVRQSHGPRTLELLLRYRTQAVGELGRLLRLFADLRGAVAAQPPLVAPPRVESAANDNRPAAASSRCQPLAPGSED
ncbi:MAG: hypothetical protein R3C69_17945 [Geminicoccaceae bacterium]